MHLHPGKQGGYIKASKRSSTDSIPRRKRQVHQQPCGTHLLACCIKTKYPSGNYGPREGITRCANKRGEAFKFIISSAKVWIILQILAIDIQGDTGQIYLGITINMDVFIHFSSAVLTSSLHSIKSILVVRIFAQTPRVQVFFCRWLSMIIDP